MIYLPTKVLVYTLQTSKTKMLVYSVNVTVEQCKGIKPVDQCTSTGNGTQNTYTELQLHLQIT